MKKISYTTLIAILFLLPAFSNAQKVIKKTVYNITNTLIAETDAFNLREFDSKGGLKAQGMSVKFIHSDSIIHDTNSVTISVFLLLITSRMHHSDTASTVAIQLANDTVLRFKNCTEAHNAKGSVQVLPFVITLNKNQSAQLKENDIVKVSFRADKSSLEIPVTSENAGLIKEMIHSFENDTAN